jgi:hypothetical protein
LFGFGKEAREDGFQALERFRVDAVAGFHAVHRAFYQPGGQEFL